jgi:hypothetical protein
MEILFNRKLNMGEIGFTMTEDSSVEVLPLGREDYHEQST